MKNTHNFQVVKMKMISTHIICIVHYQDVALLDKLIKEDIEAGKLPLLLIANAGEETPCSNAILHCLQLSIILYESKSGLWTFSSQVPLGLAIQTSLVV